MKRTFIIFGLAALLWRGGFAVGQETIDGVIAIVGDEIILYSELIQTAQGFALQMGLNPRTQEEEFEKLKLTVLQNIINEKVLLDKAKEDTITVDDQQVEQELERRIESLIQQLGSREKVEAYFGTPIKKIKKDYRDEIRKNLTVRNVQEEKLRDIQISRREVERFYETMEDSLPAQKAMAKIRHILIDVQPGNRAQQQAMDRIQDMQERLRQGEAFEDLAQKFSEDPGTSSRGGSLGFVERGTLFQSFEEAAFQMEPGQVSEVVETPVGLHLIQMVERRGDKAELRHILVRIGAMEGDKSVVLDTLESLRDRVLAGEDFGELAEAYSQDPSSNENGGDLGWMALEDLQIQAFKTATDTLELGGITRPFETQFGYHIVLLEDRSEARPYSLDEDWDQIQAMALNTKRQRVLAQWIEDLKVNVYIEIKEGFI